MRNNPMIVKYNGSTYVCYKVVDGRARLLTINGVKFSGTPSVEKLNFKKQVKNVREYNGHIYFADKLGNVYSATSGNKMRKKSILALFAKEAEAVKKGTVKKTAESSADEDNGLLVELVGSKPTASVRVTEVVKGEYRNDIELVFVIDGKSLVGISNSYARKVEEGLNEDLLGTPTGLRVNGQDVTVLSNEVQLDVIQLVHEAVKFAFSGNARRVKDPDGKKFILSGFINNSNEQAKALFKAFDEQKLRDKAFKAKLFAQGLRKIAEIFAEMRKGSNGSYLHSSVKVIEERSRHTKLEDLCELNPNGHFANMLSKRVLSLVKLELGEGKITALKEVLLKYNIVPLGNNQGANYVLVYSKSKGKKAGIESFQKATELLAEDLGFHKAIFGDSKDYAKADMKMLARLGLLLLRQGAKVESDIPVRGLMVDLKPCDGVVFYTKSGLLEDALFKSGFNPESTSVQMTYFQKGLAAKGMWQSLTFKGGDIFFNAICESYGVDPSEVDCLINKPYTYGDIAVDSKPGDIINLNTKYFHLVSTSADVTPKASMNQQLTGFVLRQLQMVADHLLGIAKDGIEGHLTGELLSHHANAEGRMARFGIPVRATSLGCNHHAKCISGAWNAAKKPQPEGGFNAQPVALPHEYFLKVLDAYGMDYSGYRESYDDIVIVSRDLLTKKAPWLANKKTFVAYGIKNPVMWAKGQLVKYLVAVIDGLNGVNCLMSDQSLQVTVNGHDFDGDTINFFPREVIEEFISPEILYGALNNLPTAADAKVSVGNVEGGLTEENCILLLEKVMQSSVGLAEGMGSKLCDLAKGLAIYTDKVSKKNKVKVPQAMGDSNIVIGLTGDLMAISTLMIQEEISSQKKNVDKKAKDMLENILGVTIPFTVQGSTEPEMVKFDNIKSIRNFIKRSVEAFDGLSGVYSQYHIAFLKGCMIKYCDKVVNSLGGNPKWAYADILAKVAREMDLFNSGYQPVFKALPTHYGKIKVDHKESLTSMITYLLNDPQFFAEVAVDAGMEISHESVTKFVDQLSSSSEWAAYGIQRVADELGIDKTVNGGTMRGAITKLNTLKKAYKEALGDKAIEKGTSIFDDALGRIAVQLAAFTAVKGGYSNGDINYRIAKWLIVGKKSVYSLFYKVADEEVIKFLASAYRVAIKSGRLVDLNGRQLPLEVINNGSNYFTVGFDVVGQSPTNKDINNIVELAAKIAKKVSGKGFKTRIAIFGAGRDTSWIANKLRNKTAIEVVQSPTYERKEGIRFPWNQYKFAIVGACDYIYSTRACEVTAYTANSVSVGYAYGDTK